MPLITYHTPLYGFIWEIQHRTPEMEKKILDCGAGGRMPPLAVFKEYGFETFGIDNDPERIIQSLSYAKSKGITLDISEADMRAIPFEDEFFSFVYSYNTIFHMTKKDMKKSMNEIHRVLKKDGLCFVNFMSVEDDCYKNGEEKDDGEKVFLEHGKEILHAFLRENELEEYFEGFDLINLTKSYIQKPIDWSSYCGCYFNCILQKK